jgi:soluble lytic murein transglycosylase-like protein
MDTTKSFNILIKASPLVALAKATAAAQSLDPALVCAICEQESDWDPWAIRYEESFFYRYVQPDLTIGKISITEAHARAISWGLMQVMGQVARETGFASHLPALCEPGAGIYIGCVVFAKKLAAAGGDVHKALQLWNGGGNPDYADQVMARMAKYQDSAPLAAGSSQT